MVTGRPDDAIDSVDGELNLVDAATGSMTRLDLPYAFLDVYWRPPNGRQLLFPGWVNPDAPDVALYVVDLDDPGSLQEIAGLPPGAGATRPNGLGRRRTQGRLYRREFQRRAPADARDGPRNGEQVVIIDAGSRM